MRDFRELRVWAKAHELTLGIYKAMAGFPRQEQYGLTSQMRRASTSIPANIAEGSGRDTNPEMGRFLQMALGSATEVEDLVLLARDLEYLPKSAYHQLLTEVIDVKRMLSGFIKKLKAAAE